MDLARESEMRTLAFSFFLSFLCFLNRGLIHCAAILKFAKENNNNESRDDEILFSFFLSFKYDWCVERLRLGNQHGHLDCSFLLSMNIVLVLFLLFFSNFFYIFFFYFNLMVIIVRPSLGFYLIQDSRIINLLSQLMVC